MNMSTSHPIIVNLNDGLPAQQPVEKPVLLAVALKDGYCHQAVYGAPGKQFVQVYDMLFEDSLEDWTWEIKLTVTSIPS